MWFEDEDENKKSKEANKIPESSWKQLQLWVLKENQLEI